MVKFISISLKNVLIMYLDVVWEKIATIEDQKVSPVLQWVETFRDFFGRVLSLSDLARMDSEDRIKLITDFYPEYLQEIDDKVSEVLNKLAIFNVEIKESSLLEVRAKVEKIIWDNTYNYNPICVIDYYSDFRYSNINLQSALDKISIEIAWICLSKAWFTEKWIYLHWLLNTWKFKI